MKLDFQSPLDWQERNDKINQLLNLTPSGGAGLLIPGTIAALSEITAGLVRQFPHKKRVVYLKDVDPSIEAAVINLSREGCQLVGIDVNELSNSVRISEVIDGNCLFFLGCEDDPLLGRVFDLSMVLKEVEAKRSMSIVVSHANFRNSPLPQNFPRHQVYVYSLAPDLTLLLASSRLRWPIQLADRVPVREDWEAELNKLQQKKVSQISLIEQFEATPPAGGQAVFPKGTPRVGDRAVIFWSDVDSWTVMSRLAEAWQRPLAAPGHCDWIEATSLHRWGGVRTMDWLRAFGFSEAMIRGTLILSAEILGQKLEDDLKRIHSTITAIQNG